MALDFDPTLTIVKGINKHKQKHPFIAKKRSKRLREGIKTRRENYRQSKLLIYEELGGLEAVGVFKTA